MEIYKKGIEDLDKYCRANYGSDFSTLSSDKQHQVLKEIEEKQSAERRDSFFETVLAHTFEGYYSHPKYGGNKNYIGWKVCGYV